jgi:PIN domain nuclease of toxin-antitoxin system
MKILLDTHIFLWCVQGDRRLSKKTRSFIQAASEVYVSSASIWESAIKAKLGKLDVDIDELVNSIWESGFINLAVNAGHAAAVYNLPDIHRDPFDRILIAQALSEPLRLLTSDMLLQQYSDLVDIAR